MKTKMTLVGVCVVGLALAVGLMIQPALMMHAAEATDCVVQNFEATVRQGPSQGWSIVGELTLNIDTDGGVTGMLTPDSGTPVALVGQVDGRAISLAFDLGGDSYVFGTGLAWNPISECSGPMGGSLVGPQPGDSGDWGYAIGGKTGGKGSS